MKITFEGETLDDIFNQMENALDCSVGKHKNPGPQSPTLQVNTLKDSVPEVIVVMDEAVEKPVYEQITKSVKPERTAKQKENDERLRAAAKAKLTAKKTAAREASDKPAPEHQQEPFADPADIVKLRTRTINDLQEAYANGHQAEVFELLSRFGNGAKSFRELPADAFVPIREAIDSGALT